MNLLQPWRKRQNRDRGDPKGDKIRNGRRQREAERSGMRYGMPAARLMRAGIAGLRQVEGACDYDEAGYTVRRPKEGARADWNTHKVNAKPVRDWRQRRKGTNQQRMRFNYSAAARLCADLMAGRQKSEKTHIRNSRPRMRAPALCRSAASKHRRLEDEQMVPNEPLACRLGRRTDHRRANLHNARVTEK